MKDQLKNFTIKIINHFNIEQSQTEKHEFNIPEYLTKPKPDTGQDKQDASSRLNIDVNVINEHKGSLEERTINENIANDAFKGSFVKSIKIFDVETIGERAFAGCLSLEKVVFNNVSCIGTSAFEGCTSLKVVEFNNVSNIGKSAFQGCKELTQIRFPNSVKLGKKSFYDCEKLLDVEFVEKSMLLEDALDPHTRGIRIHGEVYEMSEDEKVLLKYKGSENKIEIPSNFEIIANEAFEDLLDIERVDFSNVKIIGNSAFDSCRSLKVVVFNEVTEIGVSAFEDCKSLEELVFKNEVELKEAAFYECRSLTSVKFMQPPSIGERDKENDDEGGAVFERCYRLEKVDASKGISFLGISAFDKCTNLRSIEKLDGLITINKSAFRKCQNLEHIIIPDTVISIRDSAFSSCNKLTINCMALPEDSPDNWNDGRPVYINGERIIQEKRKITQESIDNFFEKNHDGDFIYKFNDNWVIANNDMHKEFLIDRSDETNHTLVAYIGSRTDIKIPDNITEINEGAFKDCRTVVRVDFAKVKRIGPYAFDNCTQLEEVILREVTHVGASAFEDCNGISKVTFNKNGITLNDSAFFSCVGLTEVTFKGNVNKIGYAAFSRCSALETVVFNGTCAEIGSKAFEKCKELNLINISASTSLKKIGDAAFRKCIKLRRIEIHNSIGNNCMKDDIFSGCDKYDLHIICYMREKKAGWPDNWHSGMHVKYLQLNER